MAQQINQLLTTEEKSWTKWVDVQMKNGTPAQLLPCVSTYYTVDSQTEKYEGQTTVNTFHHPPARPLTDTDILALARNQQMVNAFDWELDHDWLEETRELRAERSEMFEAGALWWELPSLPDRTEDARTDYETKLVENYYYDDQTLWSDDDFDYLWDHALSQDALEPAFW